MRSIIILNGKFKSFPIKKNDFVICADGGLNAAHLHKIKPDVVIGDMDSAKPSLLKRTNADVITIRNVNSTDGEKATRFALMKKPKEIIYLGALGGRIDHTLGNIQLLLKIPQTIDAKIVDGTTEISIASGKFKTKIGEKFSFIPLTKISGLTLKGFKYCVSNYSCNPGSGLCISNVAEKSNVSITKKSGKLLMIRKISYSV